MKKIELKAYLRKPIGHQVKKLRNQGLIPAVLYGHGINNKNIMVNEKDFEKAYSLSGETQLIDLQIENKPPVKVLIQAIQTDPISDRIVHVDFYQVKMTEKLTTEVPLEFKGESPAVKEKGAILVKNLDKIEIECLPQYLVSQIEVDLGQLKDFGDVIYVKDLKVPAEIKILTSSNETVALVEMPRTEEELKKEVEEKAEAEEKIEEKEEEKEEPKEEEEEKTKS